MISKHILGTFDEALGTLRNNVMMMASLTERSLDNALNGLVERDDDLCATTRRSTSSRSRSTRTGSMCSCVFNRSRPTCGESSRR